MEDEDKKSLFEIEGPKNKKKVKFSIINPQRVGTYPTRFQWVGNNACFYCSCFKKGKWPLFQIGPSWPFTIGLLLFAIFCLGYLWMMMNVVYKSHPKWCIPNFFLIALNLGALFHGICGDPGIKAHTYEVYNKRHMEKGHRKNGEEVQDTSIQTNDEEAGESETLKQRKSHQSKLQKAFGEKYYTPKYEMRDGKKVLFCIKCDVDLTEDMEHCEDCDVCVWGHDHHCVFFSKCIAGGNIYSFYAAIGLLITNFIVVCILVVFDVKAKMGKGRKSPMTP